LEEEKGGKYRCCCVSEKERRNRGVAAGISEVGDTKGEEEVDITVLLLC
jgi:hypothetical protein